MSQEITAEQIASCRGMKRQDATVKLGVTRYHFDKTVKSLGIDVAEMFERSGNIKYTEKYFDDKRDLSIGEISEKFNICIDVLRAAIKRVGLKDEYGLIEYGHDLMLEPDKLTVTVCYTCMVDSCSHQFTKEISLDVPKDKRESIPWRCSSCNDSRQVDTVHTYTGQ